MRCDRQVEWELTRARQTKRTKTSAGPTGLRNSRRWKGGERTGGSCCMEGDTYLLKEAILDLGWANGDTMNAMLDRLNWYRIQWLDWTLA